MPKFSTTLVDQLTRGITTEKIALSIAVGSLCAFFPVLGAATPLCLVAGIALGLNQPVIQIVNVATVPVYPLAVFGLVRLGDLFLGSSHQHGEVEATAALLWRDPGQFFGRVCTIAGHAVVGWAVLAPLWIVAGYFGLLPLVRAVARARRGRPAMATAPAQPR